MLQDYLDEKSRYLFDGSSRTEELKKLTQVKFKQSSRLTEEEIGVQEMIGYNRFGLQEPRFSDGGSSRDRRVIKENLFQQNLPSRSPEDDRTCRSNRYERFNYTSSVSATPHPKKAKGPNLIDRPKAKKPQLVGKKKASPKQKSLHEINMAMQFKGLFKGMFDIITDMMQSEETKLISTGTKILILFLDQDPNLSRSYVIQPEGNSLLRFLVNGMLTDFLEEMHCQFLEIIRILVNPYTMSASQDEHVIRHIVKNNLLKPVIEAFVENGNRYNMLHSGVLELLEYICKENLKSLIVYVVNSFWDQGLKFEHLSTIQRLKLKYFQI